ncbi:hypothetical protein COD72_24380 [Bacillus cereus]|nr:hypothetical protein COD72_24380 [Bacillus cereus]
MLILNSKAIINKYINIEKFITKLAINYSKLQCKLLLKNLVLLNFTYIVSLVHLMMICLGIFRVIFFGYHNMFYLRIFYHFPLGRLRLLLDFLVKPSLHIYQIFCMKLSFHF